MVMLYVKARDALKRLPTDQNGIVSFEYIIVGACVVAAVVAAFGSGTSGAIHDALTAGINNIVAQLPAAS